MSYDDPWNFSDDSDEWYLDSPEQEPDQYDEAEDDEDEEMGGEDLGEEEDADQEDDEDVRSWDRLYDEGGLHRSLEMEEEDEWGEEDGEGEQEQEDEEMNEEMNEDASQLEEEAEGSSASDHVAEYGGSDTELDEARSVTNGGDTRSLSGSERESTVSFQRFSVSGGARTEAGSSVTSYTHNPSEGGAVSGSGHSSIDTADISTVDVNDDIARELVKEEFGRTVSNYSRIYRLPLDEEERERLRKQHQMFIAVMGGKYPPPMGAIMHSTTPGEKRVLDLGAGSGCWIKDVAVDFPFCEAVAVDLAPLSDSENMPPNLRCEIDDINYGLSHFHNSFDVVHVRLVAMGINNYREMVHDISRVLRPGGLVEFFQCDYYGYDAQFRKVGPMDLTRFEPPWWPLFHSHIADAVKNRGGDLTIAENTEGWLRETGAFDNIVANRVWLPVVPGSNPLYNDFINANARADIMVFLRSTRPLLLGNGLPEDLVDVLEHNTARELNESDEAQYICVFHVYAVKKT